LVVLEGVDAVEIEGLVVVLAGTLAGVDAIVLVLDPNTNAVPSGFRLILVPEIVMTPPGVSVVPGPRMYSVTPFDTVAENVWPLIVMAGGLAPNVDVIPLMTIAPAEVGKEMVVPEMTACPPGVRVVPGPRTNTVVPPDTLAVIGWPLRVITGAVTDGFGFPRAKV